jgi:RNA polymerase sigma-70 factor (ECF subfamily)
MALMSARGTELQALGDEELMALVARRDPEAFSVVFDRHGGSAFSLAYRMCGERELAEDVVQDTVMSMWRGVGRFHSTRGSLRTWLLAATRNRMIDAFRTRTSKQAADVTDDRLGEWLAAPHDTLQEVTDRAQARELRGALQRLPLEQRVVIELAYFAGLSHSQIARRLGLPAGTVKGRMRLGLAKLRDNLGAPVASVL